MNAPLDLRADKTLLSPTFGFLSPDSINIELPEALRQVREAALALPRTLLTGRVRQHLDQLPQLDLAEFSRHAPIPQRRQAMVHYSFLIQAYVWGEDSAPAVLPANLAVPAWALAQSLGQPPLLTYANYVLDNWARIDPEAPIDLSNIIMQQPFLGGQDEAWFVLVHVAIESQAAPMLADIPRLIEAAAQRDEAQLIVSLSGVVEAWDGMNASFDRMPERCDPYIYFHRVRPWIHGWKDNPAMQDGLIYEGVQDAHGKPLVFRGQTGSQSSIMPTMDALFGIGHASDPLRVYLDELHHYRPPAHRAFIEQVQRDSKLREAVAHLQSPEITDLYNNCILKATRFRTRHLEYAASYINKQNRDSRGNAPDVGTGGTPFMKYLKKHRDEAARHLL